MSKPFLNSPEPTKAFPREAGFSLIEILVSALVVSILATAAFYFLSSQNGVSTAGNDAMIGVNFGKLKMDSLKVSTYDELASGSDTISERYIRAWHVTVVRDDAGVETGRKKIDLRVMWPLTGEHGVSLATLKSDDRYKEDSP